MRLRAMKQNQGSSRAFLDLELDKIIDIDQSPPEEPCKATQQRIRVYLTIFVIIFATTNEAKIRYKKGRFSFNVKGGRCESCKGSILKNRDALPARFMPCEVCHGTRYNSETPEVKYKERVSRIFLN